MIIFFETKEAQRHLHCTTTCVRRTILIIIVVIIVVILAVAHLIIFCFDNNI